jgi:hypothetical protein
MRIVAGVDCHKSSHTAVFLDSVGHVMECLTFSDDRRGVRARTRRRSSAGLYRLGPQGSWLLRVRLQRVPARAGC